MKNDFEISFQILESIQLMKIIPVLMLVVFSTQTYYNTIILKSMFSRFFPHKFVVIVSYFEQKKFHGLNCCPKKLSAKEKHKVLKKTYIE